MSGVDEGRRNFLKLTLGACTAIGVAATLPPPLSALFSGFQQVQAGVSPFVEFCTKDRLEECPYIELSEIESAMAEDRPLIRLIQRGSIAVPATFGLVRVEGEVYIVAYNIVCTHFGCPASPIPSGGELRFIACPCHGSQFQVITDPNDPAFLGTRVVAGPAPRGLRPVKVYPIRVSEARERTGGRVYILGAYI